MGRLLEYIERPPLLQVGVVGCGAVGSAVARAIDSGDVEAELKAVCDVDESRTQALVWSLSHTTRSMTLPGLIRSSRLVVEATNPGAATSVILQALDGGCDLLVTNPAALLPRLDVLRTAEQRGLAIYVPRGLLVGTEALATEEKLAQAALTIRVPADEVAALELPVQPASPAGETVIFEGSVTEAVRAASPLRNVIATFALALREPAAGRVRLVASPDAGEFSYGIEVKSETLHASSAWDAGPGRMQETLDRATSNATLATLRRIVSALKLG